MPDNNSWAIEEEVKVNAASFVHLNAGKLRDYYRIGKMLGSGMILIQSSQIINRGLWRS